MDKLNKKNKKLKRELNQTRAMLDKDSAIDPVGENAHAANEEFKKSNDLQEYLNSYGVSSFEMAYKDLRRYLQVKRPLLELFFIGTVKDAFLNREELDLTLVNDQHAE